MSQHSEDSGDEEFHEATDQVRITQHDIASLPRYIWRTPDPTFSRLSTRILHTRGITHLQRIDDEIQEIYKRGLNVHELNASYYMEYFSSQITDPDPYYGYVLQELMKRKSDLEAERIAFRALVEGSEPGSDLIPLVRRAENLRNKFYRLDLMLKVFEKNLRLVSLNHLTRSVSEIGLLDVYSQPAPKVDFGIFNMPDDIPQTYITELEFNVTRFWVYRVRLYSDNFIELFTRLRDCEDFDGKDQLVENLLQEYEEFETMPSFNGVVYETGFRAIHREITSISRTDRELACRNGMRLLVSLIETSCNRTEFRRHICEANNIRKQHFVVQIRGFVPKSECFPDLEPIHIHEDNFEQISQHYFDYRSLGASNAWTICDEEGNLLPEREVAAKLEIQQIHEQKHHEWLQEIEHLPGYAKANEVYRKTGHFSEEFLLDTSTKNITPQSIRDQWQFDSDSDSY